MDAEALKEQVMNALSNVQDPELHRDLVSLRMVKDVSLADGEATILVELTTPACPLKSTIRDDIVHQVSLVPGITRVNVEFTSSVRPTAGMLEGALPGVKNVVAVGSGKGGVGKSTIAVCLAVGLAREGAAVGLLDGDIYGPSIPTMFGLADRRPVVRADRLVPVEWTGEEGRTVKLISIGFLVPPGRAIIWRGPMVHNLVRQFLSQVDWGDLDYLVVDLPPGTGDVPLTLAQSIPLTGAAVVATPQELALIDARRAVRMFGELGVACLGIVENMSYYVCPNCGHEDEIFPRGGAEQVARQLSVPFLGAVPINSLIRRAGDEGRPELIFQDESLAGPVLAVVRNLAGQISIRNRPTASGRAGPEEPTHG